MLQGLNYWPEVTGTTEGLQYYLMHVSGMTRNVMATDLESAFGTAQPLLVHTPFLHLANRVAILRALARSEVHCILPGSGEQITGCLRTALQWVSQKSDWL